MEPPVGRCRNCTGSQPIEPAASTVAAQRAARPQPIASAERAMAA
jgi:hypothetical protein